MPGYVNGLDENGFLPAPAKNNIADDIASAGTAIGSALGAAIDAVTLSFPGGASGAENRAALQTAVNEAATAGRALFIKGTTFGQPAPIAGAVAVSATVRIYGAGPSRTVLQQTVKPEPTFRVTGPDVTIEQIGVLGAGLDMTGTAGPIDYARYVAVWLDAGSNGARIRHIKGTGLHRVVRVDPDGTTTATPAQVPNLKNLVVENIESDLCWCGVSAVGFDDLKLSGIRGTYAKAFGTNVDTGQPPHLIYVINRDSVGRVNRNLRTTDCLAWDSGVPSGAGGGEPAAPYAIKGVIGWTYDGMDARNCAGLLDMIALEGVTAGSATSYDDVYPLDGGRASVAIKESSDVTIRALVLAKAGGDYGRQVYIESTCTNVTVEGQFTARPTTARPDVNSGLVRVSGKYNTLRGTIINKGASMRSAVSVSSASNAFNQIQVETIGSFRYPVEVLQGLKNVVTYDPLRMAADPAAGAGATSVSIGSEAVRTVLRNLGSSDVQGPGYYDTFDRPDGTPLLGTTDGQPYTILNGGTFTTESGQLSCSYAPTGGAFAFPAGGVADGTISFKIGAPGPGTDAYLFRSDYVPANGASFAQDFLRLAYRESSTVATPRLQKRINGGTVTNVASAPAGTVFAAGDTITITMAGPDITIAHNGTTIITATDTDHTTRVASGPWVNTPASSHWKLDEIRLTPAG